MTFGEKLRAGRKEAGLTQTELANQAGIALKTVINYENGKTYPHKRDTYKVLADILHMDEQYLYNENESFVTAASSLYGARGKKEAEELIADFSGLFAGGRLSEEEKDGVMRALQDVYWKCKEDNRRKYSSKKASEDS